MISGLIARIRSIWRAVRQRPALEREISAEFRAHQELRTADLVRSGVDPTAAARQARLEFGSTERYKDEAREARGLRRVDTIRVSWLDFKLGFRMLARYPGLTLVGGLSMAFAIWIGAATFELVTRVINPTLPLDDGDRIVALRNWDVDKVRADPRAMHDFVAWRSEMTTVEDLGAVRMVQRNLIRGEGRGEPIEIAEISASAFRVTRVPPLLGRGLVDADEQPGAPAVIVIGHDLWTRQFDSDSGVVGRSVRLGHGRATVVGVMPEGYAFPVSQNSWAPLVLDPKAHPRRQGPAIHIFGRLAPGSSLDDARAEIAAIGRRMAADFPDTHAQLRPEVLPYAKAVVDIPSWGVAIALSANVPVLLFLFLVCANVALLMFARAATRETEIAVRSALGASRSRIITQLFAEALVLGALAAVVGLAAAGSGLRWATGIIEGELLDGGKLPFWFDPSLSPTTIVYAILLTVLAAVIAGVVPALKVTRGMGTRLAQSSAGGGGLRFGGIWTAVIIIQIAVTVTFPVVAFAVRQDAVQLRNVEAAFPAHEFLAVRLEMDRQSATDPQADTSRAAFAARYQATYEALESRLLTDPAVAAVTYAERFPRMYHPHRIIEMDAGPLAPRHKDYPDGYRVSSAAVAADYFEALDSPVLAGREFHSGDLLEGARTVIVNEAFVDRVLGGSNPIGRRFRYLHFEEADVPRSEEEPGEWYEIVGTVANLGMAHGPDPKVSGIYHGTLPGPIYPVQMAVRVKGNPASFIPRLRELAGATDPTLRLYEVIRLDEVSLAELAFLSFWFRITVGVSLIALVLSLAGIYAVMAFTVARRTREIGIRVALGASRGHVLLAVFRRPFIQVALGIVAGVILLAALLMMGSGGALSPRMTVNVIAYSLVMLAVCLLACVVPTMRALRVEPTEALRSEG